MALATSVAAHMHNLAEGRWYSSCSKTVRSEEWPEYVDCRNNSVPKFVPAKLCQLLYRRGPGGVLVVGDSLSDLFAATLAAMLADEAGPEIASNRAHAIWPICSNRTLEYVRNDVLDTAQAYAGNPYAEYHAGRNNCGPEYHGVSSLLCNPWVDRVAAHSVVVLNTGAHAGFSGNTTITLAMFGDMMRRTGGTTRELAQLAVFPPHLFYRTAAAGHPGCSRRSKLFASAAEANASFLSASRTYDWAEYGERNALARHIFRPLGFTLLDVEMPTSMRPDRHQVDCLHYCLPGPSMLWVQLMYASLRQSVLGELGTAEFGSN